MNHRMNDYLKNVFQWNDEMRAFLESENIEESNELWDKLDHMTAIMETVDDNMGDKAIEAIHEKVEELHSEMEQYFNQRLSLGQVYVHEVTVQAGQHQLPPLPYGYNALEPYISEEIMRLHHDKHHQSYVDGLNKAEKELEQARQAGNYALVKHWSRELAFHGSGHYLHTIFWQNMSPQGGSEPTGELRKEIVKYFGSFAAFKKHFTEAAKQVEGSGWALLVWSPRARHLEILQSEKHQNLTQWDTIPLLVLDVWEHAYYLQYKNDKAAYIDGWWNVVNWDDVSRRLQTAKEVKWQPF